MQFPYNICSWAIFSGKHTPRLINPWINAPPKSLILPQPDFTINLVFDKILFMENVTCPSIKNNSASKSKQKNKNKIQKLE